MANAKVYQSEEEFGTDVGKIRRGDVIGVLVRIYQFLSLLEFAFPN